MGLSQAPLAPRGQRQTWCCQEAVFYLLGLLPAGHLGVWVLTLGYTITQLNRIPFY